MHSEAASRAADEALWGYFSENLATGHFSYRDEYDKEIIATTPAPCTPGDILAAMAPKTTPVTIDSIWVVYNKADGEWILSLCLGQGRLNGHHFSAKVPDRQFFNLRH